MANMGWIGCDLDGTLAQGHASTIGPPIPKMVERIKKHLADGYEVRILTARACEKNPAVVNLIQDYTQEHIGERLTVTNEKDYDMLFCYDDRIKQVVLNTGELLEDLLADRDATIRQLHAQISRMLREDIERIRDGF